jgi:hypothetical protein
VSFGVLVTLRNDKSMLNLLFLIGSVYALDDGSCRLAFGFLLVSRLRSYTRCLVRCVSSLVAMRDEAALAPFGVDFRQEGREGLARLSCGSFWILGLLLHRFGFVLMALSVFLVSPSGTPAVWSAV